MRHLLIGIAAIAFLRAGWSGAMHTFLADLPLRDAGRIKTDGESEPFRYDGISYFHGETLETGESVRMAIRSPRSLASDPEAALEVFVRIEGLPDRPIVINAPPDPEAHRQGLAKEYGSLLIKRNDMEEEWRLPLASVTLQRVKLPFPTSTGEQTRVTFEFEAADGAEGPDGASPAVSIAPVIVAPNVWKGAVPWFLVGLLGAVAACFAARRVEWPIIGLVSATVLTCLVFQSGGFVSNEYFPGVHGRMTGVARNTGDLLAHGAFDDSTYRASGAIILPLFAAALEGGQHTFRTGYADVFPATRYAAWSLGLIALLVLQISLYRVFGLGIALLTGLLYSTHHIVMVLGLFHNDVDGLLLPWCMLAVAWYIRLLDTPYAVKYTLGVGFAIFGMTATKITPAFLPILFAFGWWLDLAARSAQTGWRRLALWRPPVAMTVWLAAAILGTATGGLAHPSDRNVGIEGEPFQRSVFWHMVWAANGQFDRWIAHGFVKVGRVRQERVAARTGLENTGYLRQSQRATDEVYRPDVLSTLEERPLVFTGIAATRFVRHAFQFYRITRGEYHDLSFDGYDPPGNVAIGIERDRQATARTWPGYLTRYGKHWKVAPLTVVGWITVDFITPPVDAALIVGAIVGCFLIRRPGIVVVLVGLIAAKYGFATTIHGVNRYFLFTHTALLIGLAAFLVAFWRALWAVGIARSAGRNDG